MYEVVGIAAGILNLCVEVSGQLNSLATLLLWHQLGGWVRTELIRMLQREGKTLLCQFSVLQASHCTD